MKKIFQTLKQFQQIPYHHSVYAVLILLSVNELAILGTLYYFNYATRASLMHPRLRLLLLATLTLLACGILLWLIHFTYCVIIKNSLLINNILTTHKELDRPENKRSFSAALTFILRDFNAALEHQFSSQLLQKQAEYTALRNQINPHFLYNTLDSIRGYAISEQALVTADTIEVLSRIFRYTVSSKHDIITLDQEISILNDYVKIHQYRTNKVFLLEKQIEVDTKFLYSYKVPKLILQPFIENAIKHGISDTQTNPKIVLHIYTTQLRLIIRICDNGTGMDLTKLAQLNARFQEGDFETIAASTQQGKGTGIALTNINARIKLYYGKEYGITAYSTFGMGTEFMLTLPLRGDTL